jgi:outer membrane protein OmpA-like peptidoglycan-associated protein
MIVHRAPSPAPSGDLASVPLKVQFETGSDKLTPAAVKTLDMLGRALSSSTLASYRFRIEGHTDAVGSPDLNAALSARRADTVADYIASHYGIDRSRLTSVGMGDSQMLIPTAAGVPEPRNRRVQIVNIGS